MSLKNTRTVNLKFLNKTIYNHLVMSRLKGGGVAVVLGRAPPAATAPASWWLDIAQPRGLLGANTTPKPAPPSTTHGAP